LTIVLSILLSLLTIVLSVLLSLLIIVLSILLSLIFKYSEYIRLWKFRELLPIFWMVYRHRWRYQRGN
jgi:hypothetical protein